MDNIEDNHHSREALARDPNTQLSLQYPGQDEVGPVHTAEPSPAAIIDARHDVEGGLKWVLGNFGNTTIVAIEPDIRGSKARWLDANSLADVIRWAKELNENRWNLYFCPNEPVPGLAKKPKGEEIALIRCAAFADIDAKDGRTLDDALAQVQRLPTPDLLIASGGGFQPIWMLPVLRGDQGENARQSG